jgi:hypothetical protein
MRGSRWRRQYYGVGPLKDKIKGLTRIYMQYVSTPPNPITIPERIQERAMLTLPR